MLTSTGSASDCSIFANDTRRATIFRGAPGLVRYGLQLLICIPFWRDCTPKPAPQSIPAASAFTATSEISCPDAATFSLRKNAPGWSADPAASAP